MFKIDVEITKSGGVVVNEQMYVQNEKQIEILQRFEDQGQFKIKHSSYIEVDSFAGVLEKILVITEG